jgi:hypothetical protein
MNHCISVKITPAIASPLSKSNPENPGFYAVKNQNNSFTRIPQEQFEKDCSIKLENGESITQTDIDNFIKGLSSRIVDDRTLIMEIELINGFTFVFCK